MDVFLRGTVKQLLPFETIRNRDFLVLEVKRETIQSKDVSNNVGWVPLELQPFLKSLIHTSFCILTDPTQFQNGKTGGKPGKRRVKALS